MKANLLEADDLFHRILVFRNEGHGFESRTGKKVTQEFEGALKALSRSQEDAFDNEELILFRKKKFPLKILQKSHKCIQFPICLCIDLDDPSILKI